MTPDDMPSCALCNRPGEHRCRPCGRTLCAAHDPTAPAFCSVCELEWTRNRQRSVLIGTLVIAVVSAVMLSLFWLSIVTNAAWIVALAFASVFSTIPLYAGLEHVARRRFRPVGNLPPAKVM